MPKPNAVYLVVPFGTVPHSVFSSLDKAEKFRQAVQEMEAAVKGASTTYTVLEVSVDSLARP
jgi:nicotinic acid phosphoribosyltransferase